MLADRSARARGGTRTHTPFRAGAFKAPPSTVPAPGPAGMLPRVRCRAMARPGTRAAVVGVVVAASLLVATPGFTASFGAPHRASARYAWNPGKSLVATDRRLLSIWASDCPPPSEQCATDAGPHMGVFVQRSQAGAVSPS